MFDTTFSNEPARLSKDTPVSLLEIYHDAAFEYGLQFVEKEPRSLLMRHVPNKQLTYSRLADGGMCIYINHNSDYRLSMPSPNVKFGALTIQYLGTAHVFDSMAQALKHSHTNSELTEVSLDIYISLWRNAGANIGIKTDESICWEKSFLRTFKKECLH